MSHPAKDIPCSAHLLVGNLSQLLVVPELVNEVRIVNIGYLEISYRMLVIDNCITSILGH